MIILKSHPYLKVHGKIPLLHSSPPSTKPEWKRQDVFQSLLFHTYLPTEIKSFALGS